MSDSDPASGQPPPIARPLPLIVARPIVLEYAPEALPAPPKGESRLRAVAELFILFGVFIATQVIVLVAALLVGVRDERWFNVVGTVAVGIVLLAAVVAIVRFGGRSLSSIGFRSSFLIVDIVLGAWMTVVVLVSFVVLTILLAAYAPSVYARMQQTPEAIQAMFPKMHPACLVLLSAWVAVFEETLFRGFLLTRLHAIVRSWPAVVVIGALLFALPHFYEGPIAMVMIFVLGTSMGAVFAWRRSLVPVIVWHFLFNTFEFLALYTTATGWK